MIEIMEVTSQRKGDYILIVEGAIPTAKNGVHEVVRENRKACVNAIAS